MTPHPLFRWKSALIALIVGLGLLPSAPVSASPSSSPLTIVDNFERTEGAGWGKPESGDEYRTTGPAQFGVNGSAGTITLSDTATSGAALLSNVVVQDVDITVRVQPDKHVPQGEQGAYIVARSDSQGNEYRGFLRIAAGSAVIEAAHFIAGTETSLGSAVVVEGISRGSASPAWLRMQVVQVDPGSASISLKAWVDGEAEPAEWQYSVVDAVAPLQTAGALGVGAYLETPKSKSVVVLTVDDLQATEVAQTPDVPEEVVSEDLPVEDELPADEAAIVDGSAEGQTADATAAGNEQITSEPVVTLPEATNEQVVPEAEPSVEQVVPETEPSVEQVVPEAKPSVERIAPEAGAVTVPEEGSTTESTTESIVPEATSTTSTSFSTSNSMPLKDTNYYIPSSARFVATWGSDSNSGSKASPWRTLGKAVGAASSGTTIVVRGGTYRESIKFYGKALTIQPYPYEKVWLKGSNYVSGWVRDGATWRKDNWNYEFMRGGLSSNFIDSNYPYAAWPDMVFINGSPLRQVGSKSSVSAGEFYVDYNYNKLYIGSDPGGKTVEATARSRALYLDKAHGSVIRGLGFMHYATHRNQYGAVRASANQLKFENNTFAWNAAAGLTIFGTDAVVRGNTFLRNGQLGVFGSRAHGLLFEQNRVLYNNQERFKNWESGGIKITNGHNMTWRDNVVDNNFETAMWCDVECYNVKIVRNMVRNNSRHGIMYEISAKGMIASNIVARNGWNGIFVLEANDVDIYNNTIVKNKENVRIAEGSRTSSSSTILKKIQDVVVKNNIYSNSSVNDMAFLVVKNGSRSLSDMGVVLNYNGYHRTSSSAPYYLAVLADGDGHTNYRSVSGIRNGANREWQGLGIDNTSTNPFFVDESSGNYHLKSDSVARGRGQALPSSIASAIGVQSGVSVNLGALRWPGY